MGPALDPRVAVPDALPVSGGSPARQGSLYVNEALTLVIVAGVVPWRPTPTAAVFVQVPELPGLGHDGRWAWQAMMAAPAAGLASSSALAAPAVAKRALPTSAVAAS